MNMLKRGVVFGLLLGMVAFAGCGGSGGSSPQSALDASVSAFADLIDYYLASCIDFPCNCPGGGTISADGGNLTLNDCVMNGQTFNGTFSFDGGDSYSMNMSEFGECSNVTGSVTGVDAGVCSGTVSGVCAGESFTCSFDADCEGCTI